MVYAKAVPNGTAVEAARFVTEEILLSHSTPAVIVTDQGKEFVNQTFDIASTVFGFRHKNTAPYHPQTNGLTERFNGTLAAMISAYTTDQRDWNRFLPHCVFAYNTSVHEVTGLLPAAWFRANAGHRTRDWLRIGTGSIHVRKHLLRQQSSRTRHGGNEAQSNESEGAIRRWAQGIDVCARDRRLDKTQTACHLKD